MAKALPVFLTASWEEYERALKELRLQYGSKLRFRGQTNSEWKLTTTLERNGAGDMLFGEYYRLICSTGPEVTSFTGRDVPDYDHKIWKTFADPELLFSPVTKFPPLELYRYMAYLRHHGFPSPLLDWSLSPYVAAFFAFRDQVSEEPKNRSIFVYCDEPQNMHGGTLTEPNIRRIGPYVPAHQRHFRQQCDYTICGAFDRSAMPNGQWRFSSHQKAFDMERRGQDYLWKIDIPSSERMTVLRILNDYNLNAFSLFGSEESLLETMWFREYVSSKKWERSKNSALLNGSALAEKAASPLANYCGPLEENSC